MISKNSLANDMNHYENVQQLTATYGTSELSPEIKEVDGENGSEVEQDKHHQDMIAARNKAQSDQ